MGGWHLERYHLSAGEEPPFRNDNEKGFIVWFRRNIHRLGDYFVLPDDFVTVSNPCFGTGCFHYGNDIHNFQQNYRALES